MTSSDLRTRDLHPALGAEVMGLDTSRPLDEETSRRLQELFDERGVLLFRDLDIDEDYQRALVFTMIREVPPEIPPPADDEEERHPVLVSNKAHGGAAPYGRLLFHCDAMWARTPQPVISLYGVEVEPPSVPTLFVSMVHGYDTLPDDLKARLEGLEARHGFEHTYPNRGGDDDVQDTYYEDARSTVTPLLHRHPRTGRPLLYASQQATIEIVGVEPDENEALLAEVFDHLYAPENVLQHDWREGDLVVWDNRALQHARGTVDLEGPERTLRKVFGPMTIEPDELQLPYFSKARA
jgi:taurine dioxygenase